jgi:hypothetical protein
MLTLLEQPDQPDETPAHQPDEHQTAEHDAPVLLTPIGEASAVTLGQGKGSSVDKRRAYN